MLFRPIFYCGDYPIYHSRLRTARISTLMLSTSRWPQRPIQIARALALGCWLVDRSSSNGSAVPRAARLGTRRILSIGTGWQNRAHCCGGLPDR
jgi:hypothetical protein